MYQKLAISLLLIPIFAVIYSLNSHEQKSLAVSEIKPILTVGLDRPVEISPDAQAVLEGNGVQFKPANIPPGLPVSAEKAIELANKTILPALTRPPIKTTVEFVSYTDNARGLVDKNVWKVVYWGTSLMMTGPGANPDGSTPRFQQPNSKRAITYVLIDPTDPEAKKDFIATGSAGPIHD